MPLSNPSRELDTMPMYDRSGTTVATFHIGRWRCLRQEWMIAGEVITPRIQGWIRLGALREALTLDVKVDLVTFFTPARFLIDDWLTIIKNGPAHSTGLPQLSAPATGYPSRGLSSHDYLGLGNVGENDDVGKHWIRNYNKCWNWYFRHP